MMLLLTTLQFFAVTLLKLRCCDCFTSICICCAKVTEEQLIAMLDGADASGAAGKKGVVVQRRKYGMDDDDDEDDSDLL